MYSLPFLSFSPFLNVFSLFSHWFSLAFLLLCHWFSVFLFFHVFLFAFCIFTGKTINALPVPAFTGFFVGCFCRVFSCVFFEWKLRGLKNCFLGFLAALGANMADFGAQLGPKGTQNENGAFEGPKSQLNLT